MAARASRSLPLTANTLDPYESLLRNALTSSSAPQLFSPAHRLPFVVVDARQRRRLVCAAYTASCIPGTYPARAVLFVASRDALPSGAGTIGVGVPLPADGELGSGWELRDRDFCKAPRTAETKGAPQSKDCFCPTYSLFRRSKDPLGFGRQVPSGALPGVPLVHEESCTAGAAYVVYQCSRFPLVPPPRPTALGKSNASAEGLDALATPARSAVDVYVATIDHFGHGLFAMVERVLNQVWFAQLSRLEPFVFIGHSTFMEPQACEYGAQPYFDPSRGPNVWEYWFLQPGHFRLGQSTVRGRPIRSFQVANVEFVSRSGPVKVYGATHSYDATRFNRARAVAHRLLGRMGEKLIKPQYRRQAAAIFQKWRERSSHVLGVHARGTDKVVRKKVPPEAYFGLMDAYLAAFPDALLFVSTEDHKYWGRFSRRYNASRMVSLHQGYQTLNVISDPLYAQRKGDEALLDALLLAHCDFLLKSASAVAEFAMWVRPQLEKRHLDLQLTDRFRSQQLPEWLSAHDAEKVADAFCDGLERGCKLDAYHTESRYCSQCLPRSAVA